MSLPDFQISVNKNNYSVNPHFSEINQGFLPKELFTREREIVGSFQSQRIIQKNLVYIIGLSRNLIDKEDYLLSRECLGQYGKVIKLVVNKVKTYNENGPNGPSYSCYVTFSSIEESSLAILALDGTVIDNHIIKASYGTTKYCTNFLRNSICQNQECLYLHHIADEQDIISRNEMSANRSIFASQHLIAIEISKILTDKVRERLEIFKNERTFFPNPFTVYSKDVVIDYMSLHKIDFESKKESTGKKYITMCTLLKLYKSKDKSRFDFATGGNENKIDVPELISSFITTNFSRNILFKQDKNEILDYYFSSKKSNDSKDIWSFLINTLKLYSDCDYTNEKISLKNDSCIVVEQFNSV